MGTLGFKNGKPKDRHYDACYYEVSSVNKTYLESKFDNLKDGLRVYVRINKAKNMNVYIYGGDNRDNATKWVMIGSAP